MNRALAALALVSAALLGGCAPPDPLADGLSEADQERLIELSIEEIEAIENFTAADFEASQLRHFETMTADMREAALKHLPTRVTDIQGGSMSQSLELDADSASIEWNQLSSGEVRAKVTVIGTRYYEMDDGDGEFETRYVLPWTVSSEDGELVMLHQGIRTVNL